MASRSPSVFSRILLFGLLISGALIFLLFRLFAIQFVHGDEYREKAFSQRLATVSIEKIRGDFLDRNGIPLTRREEQAKLLLFPGLFRGDREVYSLVQSLTGISGERLMKIVLGSGTYASLDIVRSIPELELKIDQGEYPGLMILREWQRYDEHSLARHVIGYLRDADGEPMAGLEKSFNEYLDAGVSKLVYAHTDARERIIPGLGYKIMGTQKPYYDIKLTLDYSVQKILEDVLDRRPGKHGGIVVDVRTGEILAMASRPNFDQNDIYASAAQRDAFINTVLTDYPPGSLFKIVVAAGGLESGQYSGDEEHFCSGGIDVGGVFYSCHPRSGGLGNLTIREAFAHSCNDAFIKMADELGGDVIVDLARQLGLGQSLDIGLDNRPGSLPDRDDYAGAGIGNLAIGQGKVMVTPLQIADLCLTIANGGIRKRLTLVKELISNSGEVKRIKSEDCGRVLSERTASKLQSWMADVTEYGTAPLAWDGEIGGTAGKTGTPQVAGDPDSRNYGWFAGFFPREKPRYVIVILSREEGGGGQNAAPIFREVAHRIWEYENSLVMMNN